MDDRFVRWVKQGQRVGAGQHAQVQRYDQHSWSHAASSILNMPALRAYWPTSSVGHAQPECTDVSGHGNHLQAAPALGDVQYTYDGRTPCAVFGGVNQYLVRADGGAANWADIRGTESYVVAGQRGLTIGGWFKFGGTGAIQYLMSKYLPAGNQRSYMLYKLATDVPYFTISTDGIATVNVAGTTAIPSGQWYFIAARYTPSTELKLWLNETTWTNVVGIPASILDSTADFMVGWGVGVASYFLGSWAHGFLCACAVSDTLVESAYHQLRAGLGV